MCGESVGSCPPNIFSMADRANIVVEPGVSLVLKLKLCMLMLLFKKFSDFAQSKSSRIKNLCTKVCQSLTLHDLMPWYIFVTKGMQSLSRSLNSPTVLCITADSCLQVYSHISQLHTQASINISNLSWVLSLDLALAPVLILFKPPGNGLAATCHRASSLEEFLSHLRCLLAVWVHLYSSTAEQLSLNLQAP